MNTKKNRKRFGIHLALVGFLAALSISMLNGVPAFAVATTGGAGGSSCTSSDCATWTNLSPPELTYQNKTFSNYQSNSTGSATLTDNTTCTDIQNVNYQSKSVTVNDFINISDPSQATAQFTHYTLTTAVGYGGTVTKSCVASTPTTVQLSSSLTVACATSGNTGTACSVAQGGSGSSGNNSVNGCPLQNGGTLAWILCPILTVAQNTLKIVSGILETFLYTPDTFFSNGVNSPDNFEGAFNTFRDIGLALVVIAGLVMVVTQAAGLEVFAAYTVRRALPRIVLAAIGMALAWPILQFVITFFDDIGSWTQQLILLAANVKHVSGGPNAVFNDVVGAVTVGVIAVVLFKASAGIVILLFLTLVLAFLVALLILTIRQMVILICIITAPLAIAASVLPGTASIWNLWRKSFLSAMFMFPIIMAFLGAGLALSSIAGAEASTGGIAWDIMAILALIVPLLMLPFAFKLSGGLMGAISGAVMNASQGGFNALSSARNKQVANVGRKIERRFTPSVLQARSRAVKELQARASKTGRNGLSKFALGGLAGAVGGYNIEAVKSARTAAAAKLLQEAVTNGDDTEFRASTVNKGWALKDGKEGVDWRNKDGVREFKTLGGAWVKEGAVDSAQRRWGRDTFQQQQNLAYEMSRATTEEEVQGVAAHFNDVADGWGMSESRRKEAWLGAAFANQNQHLEYKRMSSIGAKGAMELSDIEPGSQSGQSGQEKFVQEIYEKRGSYNMAQMGSNTIEELRKAYTAANLGAGDYSGRTLADGTMELTALGARKKDQREKIQAIAQTFMHEYSSGMGAVNANGEQIQTDQPGRTPTRQASTPGAAHIAERVVQLAKATNVYQAAPTGNYTLDPPQIPPITPHAPTSNTRQQN